MTARRPVARREARWHRVATNPAIQRLKLATSGRQSGVREPVLETVHLDPTSCCRETRVPVAFALLRGTLQGGSIGDEPWSGEGLPPLDEGRGLLVGSSCCYRYRNRTELAIPTVENTPSDSCSLCGKNYKTCHHPWNKPFSNWPPHLVHELPSHPSPEADAR